MILNKKGQSSVEYLTTVGVILTFVAILAGYATVNYGESTKFAQVNTSLSKLKNSAESVYAFGPGNREKVRIVLPTGTTGSNVQGNTISFDIGFIGGIQTVDTQIDVNVSGVLPSSDGIHFVLVEAMDGNAVFSGG